MPRTGYKSYGGLSIQLTYTKARYHPGEQISGQVVAQPPASTIQEGVQVMFFGRAKSKITINHKLYRGRAAIFTVGPTSLKEVAAKVARERRWAFTFVIPHCSSPLMTQFGDSWDPEAGFLSTDKASANHSIPSVCYWNGDMSRLGGHSNTEMYVEYAIEAMPAGQVPGHVPHATLPLLIQQISPEEPIVYDQLGNFQRTFTKRSKKLLPDYEFTKPTLSHRLFRYGTNTSKKVAYHYDVSLRYPLTLQLDHPEPLPIRVAVTPSLDPGVSTLLQHIGQDQLPPVMLTEAKVTLLCTRRARANAVLAPFSMEKTEQYRLHHSSHVQSPLQLSGGEESTTSGMQNIGKALGIVLSGRVDDPHIYRKTEQLYPSFTSYNIAISYALTIKLEIQSAGDKHSIAVESPITLLNTSETQLSGMQTSLSTDGMQSNYDDLKAGVFAAGSVGHSVFDNIANIAGFN